MFNRRFVPTGLRIVPRISWKQEKEAADEHLQTTRTQ
jgi:hypothetical protein